jgi:hypothetical protein
MEYVAIPEGSSSAAPVINPGPRDFSNSRIQRDGADAGTEEFDARFLSIKVQTPKGLKLSSDPVHAWAVSAALIRGFVC